MTNKLLASLVTIVLLALASSQGQLSMEGIIRIAAPVPGVGYPSSGAEYHLVATIDDTYSSEMAGGEYEFFPGAVSSQSSSSEDPTLRIRRTEDLVEISWEPASEGFVLEQTESLTYPGWRPLPEGEHTPVQVPANSAARYFRLRKN
jgi:hypothetical protein